MHSFFSFLYYLVVGLNLLVFLELISFKAANSNRFTACDHDRNTSHQVIMLSQLAVYYAGQVNASSVH